MVGEPFEHLLSFERVIELHRKAAAQGEEAGLAPPKQGCVEGCLGNAWSAELYHSEDDTKQGFLFAAFLFYYLARNHCFVDGNKRVAWLALTDVLARLGLTLEPDDDNDAERFVNKVASGEIDEINGVLAWLNKHLTALSPVVLS